MNNNEQNKNPSDHDINKESTKPENKSKRSSDGGKIEDFDFDSVSLVEDVFAQYYDENGNQHLIKRFTWKNKNHIQVQVINYGARVISLKLPDRQGDLEDVLLGFDDLAGYLFYDKYYFGAVIGRMSNVIKNSTFVIDNKRFNVSPNYGKHCVDGGCKGLDKYVFDTYITGKKVIMSCISPDLSEGFPGALFVRVIFELSAKNEFRVSFEAQTTKPTCIDLSHLMYFNLAGHYAGPDEIYRHILTLNCNCFTPTVDKIPTGEIFNVIHTQYDFQVPKILGKVMGIVPKDGFDQNLCVNRAMYQNECFVGRILHPPSGRMLEIYSNQPGVRLNTANNFGYGIILSMEDITKTKLKQEAIEISDKKADETMLLFKKIHEKVNGLLNIDKQQNFEEIMKLILKFHSLKTTKNNDPSAQESNEILKITPMQNEYLTKAREIVCANEETDNSCLDLKEILSTILKVVKITESAPNVLTPSVEDKVAEKASNASHDEDLNKTKNISSSEKTINENAKSSKTTQSKTSASIIKRTSENVNTIPDYYKRSEQIRGKERALYRSHGGIALQTQNYPNAVNMKHFPSPFLYPGDVYKHDIVYRFWIRAGNPTKWIKRNLNESKKKTTR